MTINDIIITLIKSLIGAETIIFSDQNAPRPSLPYWTLHLSSQRKVGRDSYSQGVDHNGDQMVCGVREITVQLQRFGPDSDVACAYLRDNLSRTTVMEDWQRSNIALYNVGDVLNVPYKLDNSRFEQRSNIDLFIRVGTELLDRVGIIEELEISSEYITNQTLDFNQSNQEIARVITVML